MNIQKSLLVSICLVFSHMSFAAQVAKILNSKTDYETVCERREKSYNNACHQAYMRELEHIEYYARHTTVYKNFWETYIKKPSSAAESCEAYELFLKKIYEHLETEYCLNQAEAHYILLQLQDAYKKRQDESHCKDLGEYTYVKDLAQEKQRMIDIYHQLETDDTYAQEITELIAQIDSEELRNEYINQCLVCYKRAAPEHRQYIFSLMSTRIAYAAIENIEAYLIENHQSRSPHELLYIKLQLFNNLQNYKVIYRNSFLELFIHGKAIQKTKITE